MDKTRYANKLHQASDMLMYVRMYIMYTYTYMHVHMAGF